MTDEQERRGWREHLMNTCVQYSHVAAAVNDDVTGDAMTSLMTLS